MKPVLIFLLAILSFLSPLRAQVESNKLSLDFPKIKEWAVPAFKDMRFSIPDFGAKEKNILSTTKAIRDAIMVCHESGGGNVVIPKGIWETGPIHLKSNVNLHLEEGAELLFSQHFSDYLPVVLIQRGGFFCYNYSPFIYARNETNIAVTGKGVLNGRGQVWWPWKKKQPGMVELFKMGKSRVPVEKRVFGTEAAGVRPPFIQFLNCRDVFIEGVTVLDGPSWNIHPVFCQNVTIRGIKIISHGPNNDGIDPDGCKNVLIEDCLVDVGDDNICLKSGRDEEAWEIGHPCENVIVRRCRTLAGHGGFVIGSEMSAGVKNVIVEDCHFSGTQRGLRFKSRLGRGGIVENIHIRNISMDSVKHEAITFDLRYDSEPIEKAMSYGRDARHDDAPVFKNISIENVKCVYAGKAIFLRGLPQGEYLHDIRLNKIFIGSKSGVFMDNVKNITMQNLQIVSPEE